jgi:poly(3-hydroxybutyrate) depolymerase
MKQFILHCIILTSINIINAQQYYFSLDGHERNYIIYVPAGYDSSKEYPLVLTLHGLSVPWTLANTERFYKRSDIMECIVVFPNGLEGGWNMAEGEGIEQNFISSLIDTIKSHYSIDPGRVYATGHSNGAHFTYNLAVLLRDKITAIAPVEGLMWWFLYDDSKLPTPVMHIHALDDSVVPYDGYTIDGKVIPGVDSLIRTWRDVNNCVDYADTIYNRDGVTGIKWADTISDNDAILYIYETAGHMLPEAPIPANELIYDFFFNHPKHKISFRLSDSISTSYKQHSDIEINTVADPPDSVLKVEFYADSVLIGEDLTAPFSFVWEDVQIGDYYLYARAYDADSVTYVSTNPKQVRVTLNNVALNKPGGSSSVQGPLPTSYAFDGDFTTRWSSEWSDPQWIAVDLKNFYEINTVTLSWEQAFAKTYRILGSEDFVNWQVLYSTDNCQGGTEFISVGPARAKYVCILGTERQTIWGYSLWEFQVDGDSTDEFHDLSEEITVKGVFTTEMNPSANNIKLQETVRVLKNSTETFILTQNGFWLGNDDFVFGGTPVNIYDSVVITGLKREKKDSLNNHFFELDIQDLDVIRTSSLYAAGLNKTGLNIYPNPASQVVNLEFNQSQKGRIEVVVTDIKGNTVFCKTDVIYEPGIHRIVLDVEKIPAGVYLCKFRTGNGIGVRKFIIAQ